MHSLTIFWSTFHWNGACQDSLTKSQLKHQNISRNKFDFHASIFYGVVKRGTVFPPRAERKKTHSFRRNCCRYCNRRRSHLSSISNLCSSSTILVTICLLQQPLIKSRSEALLHLPTFCSHPNNPSGSHRCAVQMMTCFEWHKSTSLGKQPLTPCLMRRSDTSAEAFRY